MNNPTEVSAVIFSPVATIWSAWTKPQDIVEWHFTNDQWSCTEACNELRVGGQFNYIMASKDGRVRFDFSGQHTRVRLQQIIESRLDDGRNLEIRFKALSPLETLVIVAFEPETSNPLETQEAGWREILGNFQRYVEGKL